jgi:RNA polymerase sigma-70 factor (ECF subfamily)
MNNTDFTRRLPEVQAQLYRVAYGYLGSSSMALDAVSDAVGAAFRAAPSLRQPEYFNTWITRIVINQCKMELRRNRREQPLEALPETATEAFDALPLKQAVVQLPQ